MSGSGAVIVVVVFLVVFLAVGGSIYSRRGSGIDQHPLGSERGDAAGGAAGSSRMSASADETEGLPDTHGTR